MQVLVMNVVLCFYFVYFSATNNMCTCVNYSADINREGGKVKFKFIKKCIFLPFIMQGCCHVRNCGGMVNAFMHRVSFYK